MRDYRDAKEMAHALEVALSEAGKEISQAESLEIIARQFGFDNWTMLAAKIDESQSVSNPALSFERTCPIIRIFDEGKAREFYVDFLGFRVDWEHRFGENFPLYMQVSRAGLIFHLSGHYGDASPGSNTFVAMKGVEAYQRELISKDYTYLKPGVETLPWGLQMEVVDPFSNRIRFCEQDDG